MGVGLLLEEDEMETNPGSSSKAGRFEPDDYDNEAVVVGFLERPGCGFDFHFESESETVKSA